VVPAVSISYMVYEQSKRRCVLIHPFYNLFPDFSFVDSGCKLDSIELLLAEDCFLIAITYYMYSSFAVDEPSGAECRPSMVATRKIRMMAG
jgi:hypothetical protein